MAAITFLDAPVDVTPADDNSYKEIDVTAYVSSASGVLLRVSHTSTAVRFFAARKKGSTDDIDDVITVGGHIYYAVGIDGDDIFECRLQTTSLTWYVELIGYFDSTDVVFLDDGVLAGSATEAWTDWDISSETGVDTAIAGIFAVNNKSSIARDVGLRENGSTDNRTHKVPITSIQGAIVVGVDGNEVLEYYQESDLVDPYLIGYFKSGVTMNSEATDISLGSTGAWADLSSLGSSIDGIFVEAVSSTTNESWGLRPDGDADFDSHYADIHENHGWGIAGAVSDVVEGKIESAGVDFYLLGTVDSDGGGTTTLTATSGSFSVTGTATSLKYDRVMPAVSGSYALSGTAVAFDYTKRIDATSGSFAVTGTAVGFEYHQVIDAVSGSYSVTGTAGDFLRDLVVTATSGTYALTGTDVDFALEIIFPADSGSFAVTGTDVTFLHHQVVDAESGSFALSGSDVTLTYSEEEEAAAGGGGGGRKRRKKRREFVLIDGVLVEVGSHEEARKLLALESKEPEKEAKTRTVRLKATPVPVTVYLDKTDKLPRRVSQKRMDTALSADEYIALRMGDEAAIQAIRLQQEEEEEMIIALLMAA